ncbi:MAG: hypothetical protein ACFE0O_00930 [Opitutales bacterium]
MTELITNPDSGITGLHWVRYGTAGDQKYLVGEFKETYDQLVVNGNMVAHMPSALSHFITQSAQKPFVIDPQTHAFAHDLTHLQSTSKSSEGEVKRSWKKLLSFYGPEVNRIILEEERPLDPEDFAEESAREAFAQHVLEFQNNAITKELKEGEDREYLEFLQQETGIDPFIKPPAILIAPYFYIDGPLYEDWLKLNLSLIDHSRKLVEGNTAFQQFLAAELVLSKDILGEQTVRDRIIEEYSVRSPDAILLWIDNFSEHNASEFELEHYKGLLGGFGEKDIPVVNLFGGYFSVALAKLNTEITHLHGVCHGLEYGETRPVIPLGGGVPVARFYSRQLHHRLPPRVALRAIQALNGLDSAQTFHANICNCPQCLAVISANPSEELAAYFETKTSAFWRAGKRVAMEFPTSSASDNCTRHYLHCKEWEYSTELEAEGLKAEFLSDSKKLRKALGSEFAGHLEVWERVVG